MSESASPSAFDWAAKRGQKWRDQLSGLEAMMQPVDAPLLTALRLDAPCRIADIGCGGGGTTLEIHKAAPKGSQVDGFDISPDLIEAARLRVGPDAGAPRFMLADMGVDAPDSAYDRLSSRFGTMFFDDPPAAFGNLLRWLKPDGRFAFAVWGPSPENPWVLEVRDAVAQAIDVPKPDPEAPGPFRYAKPEKLVDLLSRAGFRDIELTAWQGHLPVGGAVPAAQAAQFALNAFSAADALERLAPPDATRVHDYLTQRFQRQERDGAVWMGASVFLVSGGR